MTTDVRAVLLTSLLKHILMPRLGCLGRLRLAHIMTRPDRLRRRESAEVSLGQDAEAIRTMSVWPVAFVRSLAWAQKGSGGTTA